MNVSLINRTEVPGKILFVRAEGLLINGPLDEGIEKLIRRKDRNFPEVKVVDWKFIESSFVFYRRNTEV